MTLAPSLFLNRSSNSSTKTKMVTGQKIMDISTITGNYSHCYN